MSGLTERFASVWKCYAGSSQIHSTVELLQNLRAHIVVFEDGGSHVKREWIVEFRIE